MSKPQVVFFGTGPVAAKSLQLLNEWADVEAVITKPKPDYHKGSFPVLELAEKLGLKVMPVTDKTSLDELIYTNPFKSQLGVLIDFGIIVSQDVIDFFPLGIVNSHFSLLPEWRGADPITFSILSGQPETGVSLMLLVAGMDEGPLLAQATYDLPADIATPQLSEDLIDLSNQSLEHILPLYLEDALKPAPQEQVALPGHRTVSYSRKLSKADSILDFAKPAAELEREIRAFADWPKSRTTIGDKEVVITKAHIVDGVGKPGELWHEGKEFGFYTADGILVIDTLKPAGKGEMPASAFLAGYRL